MSKIAILTDSSCDIPQELAERYGIDVFGFPITLDGKTYIERQDFTQDEFYDMMRQAQGVPRTAAITSLQFFERFCQYIDEGYTDLLLMTLNRGGSSTYDHALLAMAQLDEERPGHDFKIRLVDGRTYSMAFGWYLCEAARRIRNGAEVDYVVRQLEDQMDREEICLAAFTLRQMKKSGRISAAAAFAGELLGLRPIISLIDGKTRVEAKVRGDAAVAPAMIKYVKSRVESLADTEYQLAYTDNPEKLKELEKLCKKEFGHPPVNIFKLGGAVSANTGPDALAIAYQGKPRGGVKG